MGEPRHDQKGNCDEEGHSYNAGTHFTGHDGKAEGPIHIIRHPHPNCRSALGHAQYTNSVAAR